MSSAEDRRAIDADDRVVDDDEGEDNELETNSDDLPLEANEADVLDQRVEVLLDEDERLG
jgi:hypothetical protein